MILPFLTTKIQKTEIAIMNYIGVHNHTIVPNVFWSFFRHEVDILSVTSSGYATEIEIKISKSDLKKDKDKHHSHYSPLIKYFYFAVPEYLKDFALENIPERAGLFVVDKRFRQSYERIYTFPSYQVREIKKPKINSSCKKWSDADISKLSRLGVMRILGLKRNLLKEKLKG